MRARAVIFDVDGTLVDSNDLHAQAWVEVLGEAGFQVLFTATRRLIGKGGDKLVAELTGLDPDDERIERLGTRRAEIWRQRYLGKVTAFDGARDLVQKVKAAGMKVAVASSARREELDPLLEIAGVTDLLDAGTSNSDAEESKPDPDIVAAALARLGVDDAIMIGDTPYDIEAAHAAKIPTIAVRSGGWTSALLRDAIAIYDDVAALRDDFARSPLG